MMIVPPVGPRNAQIAFVGEAPGEQEARFGQPFVGKTGELFTRLLQSSGIARPSVYITNVIKERPPSNDISKFIRFTSTKVHATPEYLRYEAELLRELENTSANVIVPLGNVALYALTGQRHISKWRGSQMLSSKLSGLRKVIPTIHPAAIFREPVYEYYVQRDLRRIATHSEFPELRIPPHTLRISPTLSEILSYLNFCSTLPAVGFDIEITRMQIDCVSIAANGHDSMCIPFYHFGKPIWSPPDEVLIWRALGAILENPQITKVMQNGIFDASILYPRYGIYIHPIEDTLIAQRLLFPEFDADLAFQTSVYTEYPYYKDDGKFRFLGVQTDDVKFWEYSARDSLVTYLCWEHHKKDLAQFGIEEVFKLHCSLVGPLLYMQNRGIKMDEATMLAAKDEILREGPNGPEGRLPELIAKFQQICGLAINPGSHTQLKNYFYVYKGIAPYKKMVGRVSTITVDDKAMQRLARRGFEEAALVLEIRKLTKLRSTYYCVKLDQGRLKCSYDPYGTRSGRLSSRESIDGFGTNLQNQPKTMKKLMLVDKGYVGYVLDLAGAEARVVAYTGPVPGLVEAYEKGLDPYCIAASRIFSIPYSSVSREDGSAGVGKYSQRAIGKQFVLSGNYGVGYKRMALHMLIEEKIAHTLLETYFDGFPEIKYGYQAQIKAMLDKNRTVTNLFGRKQRFYGRRDVEMENLAYAWFASSTIADIIDRWGLMYMWENPDFEHVDLLNQVHDSIEFQIPLELGWLYHARVLRLLTTSIEQPVQWRARSFTIPAEVKLHALNLKDGAVIPRRYPQYSTPEELDYQVAANLEHLYVQGIS